jgi:uncharacterized protein (UPF0218 family)
MKLIAPKVQNFHECSLFCIATIGDVVSNLLFCSDIYPKIKEIK